MRELTPNEVDEIFGATMTTYQVSENVSVTTARMNNGSTTFVLAVAGHTQYFNSGESLAKYAIGAGIALGAAPFLGPALLLAIGAGVSYGLGLLIDSTRDGY